MCVCFTPAAALFVKAIGILLLLFGGAAIFDLLRGLIFRPLSRKKDKGHD